MGAALLAHRGPNVLRSAAIGDTYMLRLTPVQFQELADEFHEYRVQEANGGHPLAETSEKMVETYLYFLGGGGYLSSVGRPQGVTKSTAHLHVRAVVEFFARILAPRHIRLPIPGEYANMSMGRVGGRHIILIVDGKSYSVVF